MIYQRLSDNERTLLSAYLDGEVSPAEQGKAEALLAGSKEARTYLHEIRTVNNLSVAAFPPPIVGGAIAGSIAAKISGSAISTAAQHTSLLKALLSGPWGLAGAAVTAATIVTAVSLSINPGQVKTTGHGVPVASPPAIVRNATVAEAPISDTNGTMVPTMTPPELVRFAVEGTLPLDYQRDHYLTIQPNGTDSFVVNVGRGTQTALDASLGEISSGSLAGLDTVQRAIRSTVKAMKNGTIGIRNDFLAQRCRLIDSLENRRLALPDPLHAPLRTARRRLEGSRALATAVRSTSASRSQEAVGMVPDGQTFNLILIDGEIRRAEGFEYHIPFGPLAVASEEPSCFVLGPQNLLMNFGGEKLDNPMTQVGPITVSTPSESGFASFQDHVNRQRRSSRNAGERTPTETTIMVQEGEDLNNHSPEMAPTAPYQFPNQMWRDQDVDLQELLRHAEREIIRADSLIRAMQMQKQLHQNPAPNRMPEVNAGDSNSGSKPK